MKANCFNATLVIDTLKLATSYVRNFDMHQNVEWLSILTSLDLDSSVFKYFCVTESVSSLNKRLFSWVFSFSLVRGNS